MSPRKMDASPQRPQPVPHALTSAVRQNVAGDVVVPAEVGEIVLLPRLWGFEFAMDAEGRLELTHDSGLAARAELGAEGGVIVREIAERAVAKRLRPRAAS